MKLFNTLMSKIFGSSTPAASTSSAPSSSAPAGNAPVAAPPPPAGNPPGAAVAAPPPPRGNPPGIAAASAPPPPQVDVTAILDGMAAKNPERLDWKKSIVDLMKLVGMDSSLGARKELATELGYTGDQSDSASMNIWLHKQVMQKLAENGGKVPQNLLD
jgi:hypothetical protein